MGNILDSSSSDNIVPGDAIPSDEILTEVVSEESAGPQNGPAEIVVSAGEEIQPADAPSGEAALPLPGELIAPGAPVTVAIPLAPDGESKASNKRMLALFIQDDELKGLWERATRAQKEVDAHIDNREIAEELFDHIEMARSELLTGKDRYEQAERLINDVEYRVALRQRVVSQSNSLGLGLFIYETVWAVLLLLFLFLGLGPAAFSSSTPPNAAWMSPDVVFLLGSMTWGGLGGVIGAWLSLVRHISRDQDFDRQHTLWYINSPVMGIGVGAVVYLVLRAGLLSITGPTNGINSPLVIYLLAWLSGFQQNVFTDLVRRLLQVFKIEGSGEGSEPAKEHMAARSSTDDRSGNGRA